MAIPVPALMPTFDSAAARCRAIGSSIRLAQPIQAGCNHQLGRPGRLLCWQPSEIVPTVGASMERSFWTPRHPNTTHLHVLVFTGAGEGEGADTIAVQAGTGTEVVVGTGSDIDKQWLELVAPWGVADADELEVVIKGTNIGFQHVMVREVDRSTLERTDLVLAANDETYPAGGLRAGRYIHESTEAGVKGMIARAADAWKYDLRQQIAHWRVTEASINATDWTNPFAGDVFTALSRQKAAEATRDHRARAYVWGAVGVTGYQWRLRSGSDTITSAVLVNTSPAWSAWLTGLAIDAVTRDSLTFEMKRTGGSGLVYVQRLCCSEEKV